MAIWMMYCNGYGSKNLGYPIMPKKGSIIFSYSLAKTGC